MVAHCCSHHHRWILVYVLTQLVEKQYLDPVVAQKKLIGEIAHWLVFYAYIYYNPEMSKPESLKEASDTFRAQANASAHLVPRRAPGVRGQPAVHKASHELIGLSNVTGCSGQGLDPDNSRAIGKLLGITDE